MDGTKNNSATHRSCTLQKYKSPPPEFERISMRGRRRKAREDGYGSDDEYDVDDDDYNGDATVTSLGH